jgi:hypothetical protein
LFNSKTNAAIINETIYFNILSCVICNVINGVKEPAVSWNAYINCPNYRIIGYEFCDVITWLIIYVGEGILVFVNSDVALSAFSTVLLLVPKK